MTMDYSATMFYTIQYTICYIVYVKQQIGDTRKYVYDMDLQSAEAYVNSEYAVALTELEV